MKKLKCKVCGLKFNQDDPVAIRTEGKLCPRCDSKAIVEHSDTWIIWVILLAGGLPVLMVFLFLSSGF